MLVSASVAPDIICHTLEVSPIHQRLASGPLSPPNGPIVTTKNRPSLGALSWTGRTVFYNPVKLRDQEVRIMSRRALLSHSSPMPRPECTLPYPLIYVL